MSRVMCHVSRVTCHMSLVTCHVKQIKKIYITSTYALFHNYLIINTFITLIIDMSITVQLAASHFSME